MTAHDPALSHQEREPTNQGLFELARTCTSKHDDGFENALNAAVELLERATSSHPKATEAHNLLRQLSQTQRMLYELPDFLFEHGADA